MKQILFMLSIVIFLGIMPGCNFTDPLPDCPKGLECQKIRVAPGPEDFVLDPNNGVPRLIISSHDRRQPETSGDIYTLDIDTLSKKKLERTGEPETLKAFKPHGIDILVQGRDRRLYVILHDPYARMKREENAVAIYQIEENRLVLVDFLEDPVHLWSPNDLSVMPGGDIYATNDYRIKLDLYLRREASEISYYNAKTGTWSKVAEDIAFANGILAETDKVFVTATQGDQVMVFPRHPDGTLGDPETIAEFKGPDNLFRHGRSLLTAAHFNDFAFMSHSSDPEEHSPSVVYQINLNDRTQRVLFADEGSTISAASTAMIYKNRLFISCVFDPYIVICDLSATLGQ